MTVFNVPIPISIEIAKCNLTRMCNFVNLRVINRNKIMDMYKEYINPKLLSIDASKLNIFFSKMLDIKESLKKNVFKTNIKIRVNK
uniref:Uncharacterized protein n=1 Tax=Physcomitrium patens TaxID=3218 RepID=A0A2K1KXB9_PHYPA|nr:hypothetical protein PHYPA_005429 [Physcomitrium patens]